MTRKYGLNNRNNNRHMEDEEGENNINNNHGKGVARKRPAGLVNLGNTCFMNAALQCLSRTPNLLERLEMLTKEPTVTFCGSALVYNNEGQGNEEVLKFTLQIPQESVIRKMVSLLHQMTDGSGGTVNPRAVHHLMTRNFGAGLQHDSHELLRHVLDKLKKEQIKAFRVALMKKFDIPLEEGAKLSQSDPQKANMVKEWDRKLYNTTVIDDVFGGELLTTRTCLECNAVKTSCEEFLDISLPIRVVKSGGQNNNGGGNNRFSVWNEVTTINRTLHECFKCFVEPEILSGNNKVDCEKCHEAKLNQLKAGVPIEQVFPQEEEEPKASSSSNKFNNKNFVQKKKQEEEEIPQKKQSGRKKKRRRTRKEKMEEDPFPSPAGPVPDQEVPELDKIPDEGYAEDFKESDDSTGTSGLEQDQKEEDEPEDEDEEEEDPEENEPLPEKKVQVPKSTKTPCRRQTMIYKPPHNLTIHLKRFTVSSRGFAQKLTDHVKFTEYIDIRDYVTSSLPSVEDHEVSQASSSSWSFEELVPKETDMLGGASGDSHDLRHHQHHELDQSERIIQPPAIIPLKFSSATEDASSSSSSRAGGDSHLISNLDSIRENLAAEAVQSVTKAPEALASSSIAPEAGALASVSSEAVQISNVAPETLKNSNVAPETLQISNLALQALENVKELPLSNLKDAPEITLNLESARSFPSSIEEISSRGTESHSNEREDQNAPGPQISKEITRSVPWDANWSNIEGSLPGGEEEGESARARAKDNNAPDNQLSPAAVVSDNEPTSPGDNGKDETLSDSLLLGEGLADALSLGDPLFEGPALEEDSELAPFENADEEEPPPYPGSPTLLDESPREVVDVTLPSYSSCMEDSGADSNWRDFKTQDIVQWSFKGEDEEKLEEAEEEEPILGAPIISDLRTPHPPPLPDLWSNNIIDPDSSKIAIPMGYTSLTDSPSYGPFLEEVEPEVEKEEELLEETAPPFVTDPNGINYRLNGIVEHGGSLNWGHYVAYTRVGSDWYYVSDSYVSPSNISDVLARDPYILFYERVP